MQAGSEAAEMWFLRLMCKIKWMDRITNEEVLRKTGTDRALISTIQKRQKVFFGGHVMRKDAWVRENGYFMEGTWLREDEADLGEGSWILCANPLGCRTLRLFVDQRTDTSGSFVADVHDCDGTVVIILDFILVWC